MVMDGNGYINISFANWHPNYADGLHLLSCPVPLEIATFQQVVGRDPLNGEWVETLNEATQTYAITTFHTGIGWDNGEPALGVGQAAFFNFGPVLVPEPSVLALASLGAVTLFRFGRNCRRAAPSAGGRAQEQ
jgi:hypothetical protein